MANTQRLQAYTTQQNISDMVNAGKTRLEIMAFLQDELGMTQNAARELYYNTLKSMAPDTAMFDAFKRGLIQQNLDRLEGVIQSCLSGNTADKAIALKAMDMMNKMAGAYNDSSVVIANNKEGEQIIQIKFQ